MPNPMPTIIRERATVAEAVKTTTAGNIMVTLITPGQGSSGFYSEAVLEAAATERVFPKGTLMFLDHATEAEWMDRPERSVKDIGAILAGDATFEEGALRAPAKLVGPFAETLAEMQDAIGVSISAAGTVKEGQVTALSPSVDNSVDFVTYPGRGGSFALLESRRPSRVNARAIGHGVSEATANDTREALDGELSERFGGTDTYVWVCDFDAEYVWYQVSGPEGSETFQLAYTITDNSVVTLDGGDPVEVTRRTTYVPVSSAGDPESTTTQESQEGTMPQIEEARLRQLEADAGRAQEADRRVAEAESRATAAEAERDTAKAENAATKARETARPIAAEVIGASESLPATTKARVAEAAVAGLTLDSDGKYDAAAFRTACEAARTAAETEVAEALAAAGVGSIVGFGGGGNPAGDDDNDRTVAEAARASLFGRPAVKGA